MLQLTRSLRYIDDLLGLHCLPLQHLRTHRDTLWGFQGIYPPSLSLKSTVGTVANFLDVHIRQSALRFQIVDGEIRWYGFLETVLYDKRRDPRFANIPLVRWTSIHSNLLSRCKFNTITSQFHRFRRIITNFPNFVAELALLLRQLVDFGYPYRQLVGSLRGCFARSSHLYGQRHNFRIFSMVIEVYERMIPTMNPPFRRPLYTLLCAESAFHTCFPNVACSFRVIP